MKLREKPDTNVKKIDHNWSDANDGIEHFRIKKSYGSDGYKHVLPWLVKHMVPASSVGLIYGRSQSFKTFFLIDKCCRVAAGLDYCGKPTKQGIVYLVAAEGGSGIAKRIRAWELENKTTVGNNLIVVPHTVFPTSDHQRQALIEDIKAECERQNKYIALVVFDTMSQCANGASENDAGEVSKYLNQCRSIATQVNCTVINVHHTKKDSDDFRGSSTIEGNLDFMIAVKRNMNSQDNQTTVRLHKMKEGSTKYRWELALNEVEIDALDEDGAPVETLCVSTTKLVQLNEVSNGRPKKAPTQCEKDAEWILKLIQRAGTELLRKQIKESILSEFGQVKNVEVRIDRAKNKLLEQNLITADKSGTDVIFRVVTQESPVAA